MQDPCYEAFGWKRESRHVAVVALSRDNLSAPDCQRELSSDVGLQVET